jgi:hypothetical protein
MHATAPPHRTRGDGAAASLPMTAPPTRKWRGRVGAGLRFAATVVRQEMIQRKDDSERVRWKPQEYSRHSSLVQAFRSPHLIHPRVYLGSSYNAANKATLSKLNIRAILNCAVESRCHFPETIEYCKLELRDTSSQRITRETREKAIAFIRDQLNLERYPDRRCVLIQCAWGMSRSVCMAAVVKLALERDAQAGGVVAVPTRNIGGNAEREDGDEEEEEEEEEDDEGALLRSVRGIQAIRSGVSINLHLLPSKPAVALLLPHTRPAGLN